MKNLNRLLIGISILSSVISAAIPVVNENVANSGVITIYPDHKDPNRYYIAPNIVMIAKTSRGIPVFSYFDTRKSFFKPIGIMQMTLVPAYTHDQFESAKAAILIKNPNAVFSGVPFVKSELTLTGDLPSIISANRCNHIAGLIGQQQSCVIELTNNGRYLFRKSIKNRLLFTTLQFEYTIHAVRLLADGTYQDTEMTHGIAVVLDGDQLADYPQLIQTLEI
jgi:hypothetical protein